MTDRLAIRVTYRIELWEHGLVIWIHAAQERKIAFELNGTMAVELYTAISQHHLARMVNLSDVKKIDLIDS